MDIAVNYFAVLVAGIAGMVIGFLWYGALFGKYWMRLMNFTAEKMETAKQKGMTLSYLLAFVGSLLTAYVLAHFIDRWAVVDAAGAFSVVFWPWLGFVATVVLGQVLWEGKSWPLYFLNISYYLVMFYVQALILTYWR